MRIDAATFAAVLAALLLTACGQNNTSDLAGSAEPIPMPTLRGAAGGPPAPAGLAGCTVTRVTDGDTIDCDPLGRIRLIGMDAPERDQPPFGTLAGNALRGLVPVGARVGVEPDIDDRDAYGRALRYVWSEGVLVNWAMVRSGFAVILTYPPNVRYVDAFTAAQAEAREEGVGLWSLDGFDCPPRDHRQGRCE